MLYSVKLNYIETNSSCSRKVALVQDCTESLCKQLIISAKRLRTLVPSPKAAKPSFANGTNMSPRQFKNHSTFLPPNRIKESQNYQALGYH